MVPLVLIKRKRILEKLRKAGAQSPRTATTLAAAGVAKGDRDYPGLIKMLLREGDIAGDGEKYYLTEKHRRT